jgi:transcription antitermination factor NusG
MMLWYVMHYTSKQEDRVQRSLEFVRQMLKASYNVQLWVPKVCFREVCVGKIIQHSLRMFPGYAFVGIDDMVPENVRLCFALTFDRLDPKMGLLKVNTKVRGWTFYTLNSVEVTTIRHQECMYVQDMKSRLKVGDPVEIIGGLFKGFQGRVKKIENKIVFVSILYMQSGAIVKVKRRDVRVLGMRTAKGFEYFLSILQFKKIKMENVIVDAVK